MYTYIFFVCTYEYLLCVCVICVCVCVCVFVCVYVCMCICMCVCLCMYPNLSCVGILEWVNVCVVVCVWQRNSVYMQRHINLCTLLGYVGGGVGGCWCAWCGCGCGWCVTGSITVQGQWRTRRLSTAPPCCLQGLPRVLLLHECYASRDSCVCDMTHFDGTWLIHVWLDSCMCDVTPSA